MIYVITTILGVVILVFGIVFIIALCKAAGIKPPEPPKK
jgi:hypothetical protein